MSDPAGGDLPEVQLGRYLHHKGGYYLLSGVARHTETDELLAVYRSEAAPDQLWVRPLSMFLEVIETPGGRVPRFRLVWAD